MLTTAPISLVAGVVDISVEHPGDGVNRLRPEIVFRRYVLTDFRGNYCWKQWRRYPDGLKIDQVEYYNDGVLDRSVFYEGKLVDKTSEEVRKSTIFQLGRHANIPLEVFALTNPAYLLHGWNTTEKDKEKILGRPVTRHEMMRIIPLDDPRASGDEENPILFINNAECCITIDDEQGYILAWGAIEESGSRNSAEFVSIRP